MSRVIAFVLAAATLAAQPAPKVRLPQYTREVLANGAVLDLMPRQGVPLVSVLVLVKGGAESDPAELAGLSSLTAELLRRGTPTRTADKFSEELDFIGATFSARADLQSTVIATEFMSKDTDRALDLLSDAVLHPTFPEEEVKKALSQRIEASKASKDSPQGAAASYFQVFFFGPQHPYGRLASGDELSLKRIDRAAIAAQHARMFVGSNLIVIAAGDFEAADMRARLAKAFAAAPAGKAYEWQKDRPAAGGSGPRLLLVDKPDAVQTYFWIGNAGISRTHPDRVPVWIVNTLFGGRFTSMLNDELRVNSGLTYGASSRAETNRLTGRIAIFSYTRTDSTVKAMDLALEVLKRLREKGISAEQLASAKAYLKGTFPSDRLETSDQLAGALGEIELYGLSRAEIDDLFARIDAVSVEQANEVVRKHFGAGDLVFTLVGNAAKIRDGVKKYAPQVTEIEITAPGYQVK
ncbi:MAG: pitrilysin family protein [Bryobacteraceae bacterium]|jgi:predicted Zn-dependent peptidase